MIPGISEKPKSTLRASSRVKHASDKGSQSDAILGGRIQTVNSNVQHQSHPDLVKRLKRADGHLHNVIAMMEAGRACSDIAQQLHAVERAIGAAKKALIHDHLDHCLDDALTLPPKASAQALAEFKDITKYL